MKSSYHHGDLRTALVDSAITTIETDGVDALSMRGIAQSVGVTQSAVYHHFANKTELVAGAAVRGLQALQERTAKVAPDLTEMGFAYVAFALERPAMFNLMWQSSIREGSFGLVVDDVGDEMQQQLRGAVEAMGDRLIADVDTTTIAAWSVVHGLAELILNGPLGEEAKDEGFIRKQLDFHFRGAFAPE